MAQVIDVSMFFNEYDVLRIRLEELYPVVDKFIITENNRTLRGADKPYYLTENFDQFAKYADKIEIFRQDDNTVSFNTDPGAAAWERESWQRNSVVERLEGCDPNDIIIFGDVDEIPRRSVVANADPQDILRIELQDFSVGINLWNGWYISDKIVRYRVLDTMTPQQIRKYDDGEWIRQAGWHFSSIGSADHISNKFHSFAHSEIDTADISAPDALQRRIDNKEDIAGRGFRLEAYEIDDSWPEEIKNNREFWRKYEWVV